MNPGENVFSLIRHIDAQIKKEIDAQFKENDLTYSQSHLLYQVGKNGGSISQKELQSRLKVSHPTVVGLVQRMEKSGFLYSRVDEKDKRNKMIYLSQKAEDFHKKLMKSRSENIQKVLKGFSEEEKSELERLLNKMIENCGEEQKGQNI